MADAVGEAVWVEGGHRRHAQDVAGVTVHDDDGAGFVAEAPRGEGLESGVDRQRQGRAGLVGNGRKLAHQLAARRYLEPLGARHAAPAIVHRLFQTILSHLETRSEEAGYLFLLIFLLFGAADIADQLSTRRDVRITGG